MEEQDDLAFEGPSSEQDVLALVVSSLAVALAYLHPFSFYGPIAAVAPSSCESFSASSSFAIVTQPSCVASDVHHPSFSADASS